MRSITNHPPPHIVPGTNFNIDRFQELYSWIATADCDSIYTLLPGNHYGLVLNHNLEASLKMNIEGNLLVVKQCVGLCPNGSIVAVFENKTPQITFPLSNIETEASGLFDILITSQQKERKGHGIADEQEIPMRAPNSLPVYQLDICKKGSKDFQQYPHAIKIGELSQSAKDFEIEKYIPPVLHIGAIPLLSEKLKNYKNHFNALLQNLTHLAAKTAAPDNNPERHNLNFLTQQLGIFLAVNNIQFQNFNKKSNPEQMIAFCISFAGLFDYLLESMHRNNQLLELVRQNVQDNVDMDFLPQEFRRKIKSLATLQYKSDDIKTALYVTDMFFKLVNNTFRILEDNTAIHSVKSVDVGSW